MVSVKLKNVLVKSGDRFRNNQNYTMTFWKKDNIDENSTVDDIRDLIISKYSNRVLLNKHIREGATVPSSFSITVQPLKHMKYLKIKNDGVLDIRLVALMGGTTKSGKETLIGQFGSGLKYTLAYLLRNNLDFHIFAGTEEIKITVESETIREEQFDIICINDHRTSITTNMGKEWEAWMIVRELWSNALDEGGAQKEIVTSCEGTEDTTSFFIQVDKEVQEVLNNWSTYFIIDQEALSENYQYRIYGGGKTLRLYKQGILIHEEKDKPALFSYDILNAQLNELREFKGSVDYSVTEAIAGASKRVVEHLLSNITEDHYEADTMCYGYEWIRWQDSWKEVIGSAKIIYPEVIQQHELRGIKIEESDYIVVPKPLFTALSIKFPGVSALRIAQKGQEFYESYDERIDRQVNKALAILEACNYTMHPDLMFVYGFFEDKRTLARVHMDDKTVCISQTLLQKPLSDTIAALIEENEHFNTGYEDGSRELQNHFLKLYTQQLLITNGVEKV